MEGVCIIWKNYITFTWIIWKNISTYDPAIHSAIDKEMGYSSE